MHKGQEGKHTYLLITVKTNGENQDNRLHPHSETKAIPKNAT